MKSIKSFWGQMHQKWFGPKPKEGDKGKNGKKVAVTNIPKSTPAPTTAPSSNPFG